MTLGRERAKPSRPWPSPIPSCNARSPSAPGRPPEGYDPAAVAKALVHLAEHPRAEMVFGAETKALDLLWNHVRPLGDLVLVLVQHYFRSGNRPADDGLRALHEGIGDGRGRDGFALSRPSITNAVVRAVRGLR